MDCNPQTNDEADKSKAEAAENNQDQQEEGEGQSITDSAATPNKKKKKNKKKKNKGGGGGGDGDEEGVDKLEEDKTGDTQKVEKTKEEAVDDLSTALKELNIDRKAPDFSAKDTIEKFQEIADDGSVHFLRRARFKHLCNLMGEHNYWLNEAVVKPGESNLKQGAIKHFKKEDVQQEPLNLPEGFEWAPFDIDNDDQVEELRVFLEQNYVEDDNHVFRINYSAAKIRWALGIPNKIKELHVIVRSKQNGSILACAMGLPKTYSFQGQKIKLLEGNFLAVHSKIRSKKMAQVVLAEVFRRKRLLGIQYGVYTSNHSHPTPVVTCHYMQRYLNGERLVMSKFTHCPANKSLKEFDKGLRLPKRDSIQIQGNMRLMLKKDIPAVYKLFKEQQEKYRFHHKMTQQEVQHYLLPQEDVVWTWVIENQVDGKLTVTDFFSMYRISQACLDPEVLKAGITKINIACLYFYGLSKNLLEDIGLLCCHIAKDELQSDSFSVEQVMENTEKLFIDQLGFSWGDSPLYYYLLNWSVGNEKVGPNDIGIILN